MRRWEYILLFNPLRIQYNFFSINACFPPDIINYFSPDYPQTLLDRVEQFKPKLNIDPSMWTDRLFSDTKIPSEIKEEIMSLQKALGNGKGEVSQVPAQAQEAAPPLAPQAPPAANVVSTKRTSNVSGSQNHASNGGGERKRSQLQQ